VIAGHAVQGVDQTGLSQKAGAVVSHLHIAPAGSDVTTATVAAADADLYLSGDILQAASPVHLAKVARGRTFAVVDAAFVPTGSMLQTAGTVDRARLASALGDALGEERLLLAGSTSLAEMVFGTHLPANVVLLGAAWQRGALPLPLDAIDRAIDEQPAAAMNRQAFAWGRWLAADPDAVAAARARTMQASTAQASLWDPSPHSRERARALLAEHPLPPELGDLAERRCAQLLDYQGRARARRWLALVERAAAVDDAGHGHALTRAVAEGWFKLLTYKDEYEVARLHLRLDFGREHRVRYHLHPPVLRRLGLDHKIVVGGRSGRVLFRGLAALRHVRGTPLDIFGYARHRREERDLADEYAGLVEQALGRLPDGYEAAVDLARSVQEIRGYEDIKSAAIARWRAALATP
jgi:indolepyruvate ferredoxin oxidoreductase